jgi:class 3 adenylate cyclase
VFNDSAGQPATTEPIYSRAEVASRAGVEDAFLQRLCDLGILVASDDDRFSEGDARRARILHSLDAAGMPMDAVAEAIRRGLFDLGFVNAPAYGMFAGLGGETFAEASARTGVPFEILAAIREATGSPLPEPGDRLRDIDLEAIPAIALELQNGVRPQAVERQLRAYGDNLRRIADIEADWWASDVIAPVLARGGSLADVGIETAAFSDALQTLSEKMLVALFRGHQAHAWMRNIFESLEGGMTRAGLYNPVDRPPAICFLDLSGYTRLTDQRGDAAAADLASRLSRLVNRTSAEHGGKPIKWLGDGVMFHFRDPGPGVVAALEMVEGARESDLPPAHVGLHAGPVLFQEGDYFGRTVNVASRIADYARQGEVLVSGDVVAASPNLDGVRFDPIGAVELKGLKEAIPLSVARRA